MNVTPNDDLPEGLRCSAPRDIAPPPEVELVVEPNGNRYVVLAGRLDGVTAIQLPCEVRCPMADHLCRASVEVCALLETEALAGQAETRRSAPLNATHATTRSKPAGSDPAVEVCRAQPEKSSSPTGKPSPSDSSMMSRSRSRSGAITSGFSPCSNSAYWT